MHLRATASENGIGDRPSGRGRSPVPSAKVQGSWRLNLMPVRSHEQVKSGRVKGVVLYTAWGANRTFSSSPC